MLNSPSLSGLIRFSPWISDFSVFGLKGSSLFCDKVKFALIISGFGISPNSFDKILFILELEWISSSSLFSLFFIFIKFERFLWLGFLDLDVSSE